MSESSSTVPKHIAIIMDGNGRWANARMLPRPAGHSMGVKAVRRIVEICAELKIEALTLFAFSSENWKRPKEEVTLIMRRFLEALDEEIQSLHENQVRLRFIGDLSRLQTALQERIHAAETLTQHNTGMALVIAVAYGGRWDIAKAARRLAERCHDGSLQPADIDEAAIEAELGLAGLPDPDLLIRTGGEQRISNFLLWNLAYTELYFCDTLWPEFGRAELTLALEQYAKRQRRFGRAP
jgi:undecaprenyl diphosphate synthase